MKLAAIALACLFAVTAVAFAAVDSSVTIRAGNGGQFKGKVKSAHDACVVGRRVTVVQTIPSKRTLGHTFATESGSWALDVPADAGNEFYAKVNGYETPNGTLCRGAKSKKISAG